MSLICVERDNRYNNRYIDTVSLSRPFLTLLLSVNFIFGFINSETTSRLPVHHGQTDNSNLLLSFISDHERLKPKCQSATQLIKKIDSRSRTWRLHVERWTFTIILFLSVNDILVSSRNYMHDWNYWWNEALWETRRLKESPFQALPPVPLTPAICASLVLRKILYFFLAFINFDVFFFSIFLWRKENNGIKN